MVQNNRQKSERSQLTVGSGNPQTSHSNHSLGENMAPETTTAYKDLMHYSDKREENRGIVSRMLAGAIRPVSRAWNQRKVTAKSRPDGGADLFDARGEYIPANKEEDIGGLQAGSFRENLSRNVGTAVDKGRSAFGAARDAISGLRPEEQIASVQERQEDRDVYTDPDIVDKDAESTFKRDTEQETISRPRIQFSEKDLRWQEGQYMPYVADPNAEGGFREISEFQIDDFPQNTPIKNIEITEPDGQVHKLDGEQLEVANEIARVADAVAPQWTDYLIRLANFEGLSRKDTRLYMAHDTYINEEGEEVHHRSRNIEDMDKWGGHWSTDRGVFQINDHFFPSIPDEIADDPVRATLFVISGIQAKKQEQLWHADQRAKAAKTNIEYEN